MWLVALVVVLAASIPHVTSINLGNDSLVHEPFMVALFLHRPYTRESVHCSGTLISPDYVLTAARCFYDHDVSTINMIFGAVATDHWEEGHVTITQNTSGLTLHPDFDPDTFGNDIALIKLDETVELNEFTRPVGLYDGNETLEGINATILGYGLYDYQLKYAFNPILSTTDCLTSDEFYVDLVTDENVCFAGYGFLSACEGDFGGPLVVDGVQVGVISFYWKDEHNYCYFEQPTVCTRVSAFRSWIRDVSGV